MPDARAGERATSGTSSSRLNGSSSATNALEKNAQSSSAQQERRSYQFGNGKYAPIHDDLLNGIQPSASESEPRYGSTLGALDKEDWMPDGRQPRSFDEATPDFSSEQSHPTDMSSPPPTHTPSHTNSEDVRPDFDSVDKNQDVQRRSNRESSHASERASRARKARDDAQIEKRLEQFDDRQVICETDTHAATGISARAAGKRRAPDSSTSSSSATAHQTNRGFWNREGLRASEGGRDAGNVHIYAKLEDAVANLSDEDGSHPTCDADSVESHLQRPISADEANDRKLPLQIQRFRGKIYKRPYWARAEPFKKRMWRTLREEAMDEIRDEIKAIQRILAEGTSSSEKAYMGEGCNIDGFRLTADERRQRLEHRKAELEAFQADDPQKRERAYNMYLLRTSRERRINLIGELRRNVTTAQPKVNDAVAKGSNTIEFDPDSDLDTYPNYLGRKEVKEVKYVQHQIGDDEEVLAEEETLHAWLENVPLSPEHEELLQSILEARHERRQDLRLENENSIYGFNMATADDSDTDPNEYFYARNNAFWRRQSRCSIYLMQAELDTLDAEDCPREELQSSSGLDDGTHRRYDAAYFNESAVDVNNSSEEELVITNGTDAIYTPIQGTDDVLPEGNTTKNMRIASRLNTSTDDFSLEDIVHDTGYEADGDGFETFRMDASQSNHYNTEEGDSNQRLSRSDTRKPGEGGSLIANRSRRTGRKSQRQLEADESASLHARKARSRTKSTSTVPPSSSATDCPKKLCTNLRRNGSHVAVQSVTNPEQLQTNSTDHLLRHRSCSQVTSVSSMPEGILGLRQSQSQRRSSGRVKNPEQSEGKEGDSRDNVQDVRGATDEEAMHLPTRRRPGRPKGTTKATLLAKALRSGVYHDIAEPNQSSPSVRSTSSSTGVDGQRLSGSSGDSAFSRGGLNDCGSVDSESSVNRLSTRASKTPAWKRKVFFNSGLYSNDHKVAEDKVQVGTSSRKSSGSSTLKTSGPAFPLPTDFGYWMLLEKRDFRLPFPLSQEIEEVRNRLASKRKPPPYKHISQNRYVSRPKLPGEIMICQCPPSGHCGDACVNRQTQYLCHPKHCPCGENCTNVQFGQRKPVKTQVQWYGPRGFGLRTLEPISRGGFVDEYRGEVINYNEMVRRVRDHYKYTGNYYFLMYDAPAGEMLDGGLKGNITRFANHSCDPNCKIQKWLVCGTDELRAGEFQVALFAARDIQAGEELTYDYGWSAFSPKSVADDGTTTAAEVCYCGSANCSGFMGVKKTPVPPKMLPPAVADGGKGRQVRKKGRSSRPRKAEAERIAATAALVAASKAARGVDMGSPVAVSGEPLQSRPGRGPSRAESSPAQSEERSTSPRATATIAEVTGPDASSSQASTPVHDVPSDQHQKRRPRVSDRVTYAAVPHQPAELIDSSIVPIVTGKRQRRPSHRADEAYERSVRIQESARASQPRRSGSDAGGRNSRTPKRRRTTGHGGPAPSQQGTQLSLASSAATAGDSDVPFDFSKHPDGTAFYSRSGEAFDFARLLEKRRGQKPRVYTLEELRTAQDRHRASVARANQRRRAHLRANRTI